MAAWTEEATFPQPTADPAASRPAAPEAFAITGVPWVTIGLLLATACVLFAANLLHKDPLHLAFNAFAL